MEIGVYTFADLGTHPVTKETITPRQRMMNLMEEIELADQLGLDVFALGEHHRPDYLISAPTVVLSAAAVKTKTIKLSSAVTVLSSEDPVRVFQQFAEIDLLFPLFGYKLEDYEELFSEKLKMLLQLNEQPIFSWKGKHTQPINQRGVYPRPYQKKLPIWIGVGGTPESVVRAAEHGLPMALAIIGGVPKAFIPHIKLYRDVYAKAGHDPAEIQLSINSHTYIADDAQQARDEFYPPYSEVMNRIGRERGWQPGSRQQFDASTTPQGALLVGSPQQVIDKILYEHELFGHTRFLAQMSLGAMPHKKILHSMELLGTKVMPAVKKYIGENR